MRKILVGIGIVAGGVIASKMAFRTLESASRERTKNLVKITQGGAERILLNVAEAEQKAFHSKGKYISELSQLKKYADQKPLEFENYSSEATRPNIVVNHHLPLAVIELTVNTDHVLSEYKGPGFKIESFTTITGNLVLDEQGKISEISWKIEGPTTISSGLAARL
jgi:hypothetical protein